MKHILLLSVSAMLVASGLTAQPAPVGPSPAERPQVRPPRPGNGGPQIQPPRPGTGGPQIQPPRPGRPDVRPPRPPHHRPPHHRPPFHYPHGYHYRRWHAGLILPSLFLAAHYTFHDYVIYGVQRPPHGFHWVRYGPDLVLVNTRTGRIREVRYSVF